MRYCGAGVAVLLKLFFIRIDRISFSHPRCYRERKCSTNEMRNSEREQITSENEQMLEGNNTTLFPSLNWLAHFRWHWTVHRRLQSNGEMHHQRTIIHRINKWITQWHARSSMHSKENNDAESSENLIRRKYEKAEGGTFIQCRVIDSLVATRTWFWWDREIIYE